MIGGRLDIVGKNHSFTSETYEQNLKNTVCNLLREDESLIGFKHTKNKETYYVTVRNTDNCNFQQVRLSTHKARYAFYSNRTFLIKRNQNFQQLSDDIRTYLDHVDWYLFRYQHYFTLSLMLNMDRERITFYIENLYDVFEQSEGKVIFYQKQHRTWRDIPVTMLSESLEVQFRRLFAQGLLSSYPKKDNYTVYVTHAGKELVGEYKNMYEKMFRQDLKHVYWADIEVPAHP